MSEKWENAIFVFVLVVTVLWNIYILSHPKLYADVPISIYAP